MRFVFLAITLFFAVISANAEVAKQNRGLFAFVNGSNVQVSWRMRATDNPYYTQYQLFGTSASGTKKLIGTYKSKTTVQLPSSTYGNYTFSVVVLDKDKKEIDRQEGVKINSNPFVDIPMTAPVIKNEKTDTVLIYYTPGDASAYDMDGDGEQEIILKWMASQGTQVIGNRIYTPHAFYDCYKLDGTRLWRIDVGQNSNAGNNAAFFCWDYDGDGVGEMIVKSAPGAKDATGAYCGSAAHSNTGQDLPGYADTLKYYRRGSDDLPTDGVWYASGGQTYVGSGKSYEWVTVYDGATGKELGSCDYWPYFNIQSNWYPGGSDGAGYGRRGCSQKGGVMTIPCKDGVVRPTVCFQRGAYSYVYCTDFSWDGKTLTEEWRHASEKATGTTNSSYCIRNGVKTYQNISLFAQGAHPSETADLDGDGYDELCIGAATIDHDGTVLWSTGLGHGDAVHVGDLVPDNPGLEVWRITEGATKYDACMIDGKTGDVLNGQLYTSGDVARGLCFDIDSTHVGSEYCYMTSGYFYDCHGKQLYTKSFSNNTGYPNYRIFWDGDLCEEHFSGTCISKFTVSGGTASNYRCATPTSGTKLLWAIYSVASINGTKDNPCLQCDLFGDWREELVMYAGGGYSTIKSPYGNTDYCLRILTTSFSTEKKLPWLRDDNTYNKEIACQNIGYSMPPHIGYNPFVYYDSLKANEPKVEFKPVEGRDYYVMSDTLHYMNLADGIPTSNFIKNTTTPSTVQFEYAGSDSTFYIKCGGKYLANKSSLGFMLVSTADSATVYTTMSSMDGVAFKTADRYIYASSTSMTRQKTKMTYFSIIQAPMKCDVNGDDKVDISDINIIIDVICGTSVNSSADVNGDGTVDISDVNVAIAVICGE